MPFGLARVLAVLLCVTTPCITQAGLLDRVGVMGDSLSSEYLGGLSDYYVFGQSYRPYMSWVEQLVEDRNLNFGPSGYWGYYRDLGYQYNFASASNVDTYELLWQGQHTGLATQLPTMAVLEVGSNDFFFHAQEHAMPRALTGGVYDGQDPMVIVPGMLARYRQALEAVAGTTTNPTGVDMVLCTVPDITRTPIAVALAPALYPGSVDEYRTAIDVFNNGVRQLASERGFAVLDLHGTFDDLLGPIENSVSSSTLAGIEFDYAFSSATPEFDLFLHDGFHPGTVVHGLLANAFLETVNQNYGTDIPLLTPSEIVTNAGLTPVPECSTLVMGFVGFVAVSGTLILRVRRAPATATAPSASSGWRPRS